MSILQKAALLSSLLFILMVSFTSVQAAFVETSEILDDTSRAQLLDRLERQDVQQQLVEMGVDPEAAIQRVENMTDEEVAKINGKLDALPAGAGLSNVELLLIIIIIVLIV